MASVQLLANHWLWMTLYQSRQGRYGGNGFRCILLILSVDFILRLSPLCYCCFTVQEFTCSVLIKPESFVQIVKPRPVQAASIPGMLGMFQNVWNLGYEVFFMIFGTFYLKQSAAFFLRQIMYLLCIIGLWVKWWFLLESFLYKCLGMLRHV